MIYQVMPSLSDEDFATLKADIAARGVLIPVEYDEDGNILDGHHRVQACQELGLSWPRFIRKGLSEAEKRIHARQLNLARRHLNREQRRALIEDQLRDTPERSNRQIAAGLGVDNKTVGAVRSDLEATAEIPQLKVTIGGDGKARPAKVMRTMFMPEADNERDLLDSAKGIRAERAEKSRSARIERIEEISAGNEDLDTSRRYPIIYADPPWRYEMPAMGGTNRSIENHYPTMSLDEICAMPVDQIAADDCLLYLWATAPKLPECLRVIEAWGFEYRTHIVWVKDKIGMGYHARNQHELLLIAKRGEMPPPRPGEQPSSVIEAPRTEHSAKPAIFAETIERLYPEVGKIELFCRSPREGWSVWGNQSGEVCEAA